MPWEAHGCDMHRAGTWRGSESFVFAVLEATKADLKQQMFGLIQWFSVPIRQPSLLHF
jgi:hypothetical protein